MGSLHVVAGHQWHARINFSMSPLARATENRSHICQDPQLKNANFPQSLWKLRVPQATWNSLLCTDLLFRGFQPAFPGRCSARNLLWKYSSIMTAWIFHCSMYCIVRVMQKVFLGTSNVEKHFWLLRCKRYGCTTVCRLWRAFWTKHLSRYVSIIYLLRHTGWCTPKKWRDITQHRRVAW